MKATSNLVLYFYSFCVAFLLVHKVSSFTKTFMLVAERRRALELSTKMTDTPGGASGTGKVETIRLTPELAKITKAFESIQDDKLRYKQLLYMANNLEPMDIQKKIEENKVPGCLSTVYVDARMEETGGQGLVFFVGDSDSLLTKGLVALLVRGLSGNTIDAIEEVDPSFIQRAGISASLTPGRNNGFLNMLAVMKNKATRLSSSTSETSVETEISAFPTIASDRPVYDAIIKALRKLKPESIELVDVSHKHMGHQGVKGALNNETHFELHIIAEAFNDLNLVKRHQLVYALLGGIMPQIHALQIKARAPTEVCD